MPQWKLTTSKILMLGRTIRVLVDIVHFREQYHSTWPAALESHVGSLLHIVPRALGASKGAVTWYPSSPFLFRRRSVATGISSVLDQVSDASGS